MRGSLVACYHGAREYRYVVGGCQQLGAGIIAKCDAVVCLHRRGNITTRNSMPKKLRMSSRHTISSRPPSKFGPYWDAPSGELTRGGGSGVPSRARLFVTCCVKQSREKNKKKTHKPKRLPPKPPRRLQWSPLEPFRKVPTASGEAWRRKDSHVRGSSGANSARSEPQT